ncbi:MULTISPECIES: cell wall metabolism sensor histidine kinase WalK [Corallococcus]|uniref:sensor histidine kinase n=1 Tax=Corallococcus TaxID=83461 RepID=UPI00117E7263|nr:MULTISPECIES: ATP-binding protein [Corallococcus]NBD14385.1 PAS domain-containing protein [Corallococcus silvisoli]TSC22716.1 PAS domain-containing protein [Corallococcus sp. Z5C101001]
MPLRFTLLSLLVPPLLVATLLVLFGHPAGALAAGLVTLAGSALALGTSRVAMERQLRALTQKTQSLAEGVQVTPPASLERTDDLAQLEDAIDTLDDRLSTRAAALNQEARILTAVLDGMAEGLWVTDAEGTVVRHNDALAEMLLPAHEAIVGQRPLALIRNEALNDAVARACQEGTSTRLELTLEGLYSRTLAVRVTPVGRDLPGSAAVFHDVTELRRLEKVRKDFVANVSHELRTPITAIRGYAETLQGGALQDTQVAPKMVEIIHRQSERLSELVEDLLELSRLEAREMIFQRTEVPLALAVSRAAEGVRPKAEGKNQQLGLHVPPELVAMGDGRAIEQVLLNLLDNAVKYTPAGGRVDVDGAYEGGRCVVRVRDTGVGIESKHLSRIFERFYRVDKGRSRDMGGTGLGLSIVKHLMGAMDGEVKVESQPNAGSTFVIFLPSAAGSTAATG